ncbi:hypothetical protein GCK32_002929 [Trichostrongylus colubriformis]|uniref:G protein-coupled receptor n=1 Tax=Trichostrongylus colubriformis TaxID=6319 RepID=A0AAN8GFA1_TRICO
MQLAYINIPWMLDQKDYNCSGRTLSEWKQRGTAREVQGVAYILSMIAMIREKLVRIPCYRLMFFNGILDVINLLAGSIIVAYFQFTGAVFCTDIVVNLFSGQLAWCSYTGSIFIRIVIGFNRCAEILPSMGRLLCLFRGKMVHMWMAICIVLMLIRPFFCRPAFYNSTAGTYLLTPFISDDREWESAHYAILILPVTNMSVLVLLVLPYAVLCYYVYKLPSAARASIDKMETVLLLQAVIICSTNASAIILNNIMRLFVVPRAIVVTAHFIWQTSHGIHGVLYICVVKKIRKHVKGIFGCKSTPSAPQIPKIAF